MNFSYHINGHFYQMQLKASMDGFRLILIGDMHEQPMLHLNLKPFVVMVEDWSSEVRFSG